MLEHTNAHHTNNIPLTFSVPPARMQEVLQAMQRLGIETERSSVPWREALNVKNEDVPSMYLRGARYRAELTQKTLSEKTGIPCRHISEMENGKRPIGKMNAKKLAEVLDADYRSFL